MLTTSIDRMTSPQLRLGFAARISSARLRSASVILPALSNRWPSRRASPLTPAQTTAPPSRITDPRSPDGSFSTITSPVLPERFSNCKTSCREKSRSDPSIGIRRDSWARQSQSHYRDSRRPGPGRVLGSRTRCRALGRSVAASERAPRGSAPIRRRSCRG